MNFDGTPYLVALESEQNVIGGCMLDPSHLHNLGHVGAEHFAGAPQHPTLWTTLQALHAAAKPVDPVTVLNAHRLRHCDTDGLLAYLGELIEMTLTPAHTPDYARVVIECYERRRAVAIGRRLVASADPDAAISELLDAQRGDGERWTSTPARLADLGRESIEHEPAPGLTTGYAKWDEMGGLRPGELIVIAARPAHGKTALALNLVANAGVPTLVFSGEQDARSMVLRMLSSRARIPLQRLRVSGLQGDDRLRLSGAIEQIGASGIHMVDRPSPSLSDIQRDTRRAVHAHGIQLVVIDYLQRLKTSDAGGARYTDAVAANVKGLKELARVHNVPVVVLAQAARTCDERENEDRCPRLSDLQHSSAIEQEADVVIGLYRARAYEPAGTDHSALLRVVKNRQGRVGNFRLAYRDEIVTFAEFANEDYARRYG